MPGSKWIPKFAKHLLDIKEFLVNGNAGKALVVNENTDGLSIKNVISELPFSLPASGNINKILSSNGDGTAGWIDNTVIPFRGTDSEDSGLSLVVQPNGALDFAVPVGKLNKDQDYVVEYFANSYIVDPTRDCTRILSSYSYGGLDSTVELNNLIPGQRYRFYLFSTSSPSKVTFISDKPILVNGIERTISNPLVFNFNSDPNTHIFLEFLSTNNSVTVVSSSIPLEDSQHRFISDNEGDTFSTTAGSSNILYLCDDSDSFDGNFSELDLESHSQSEVEHIIQLGAVNEEVLVDEYLSDRLGTLEFPCGEWRLNFYVKSDSVNVTCRLHVYIDIFSEITSSTISGGWEPIVSQPFNHDTYKLAVFPTILPSQIQNMEKSDRILVRIFISRYGTGAGGLGYLAHNNVAGRVSHIITPFNPLAAKVNKIEYELDPTWTSETAPYLIGSNGEERLSLRNWGGIHQTAFLVFPTRTLNYTGVNGKTALFICDNNLHPDSEIFIDTSRNEPVDGSPSCVIFGEKFTNTACHNFATENIYSDRPSGANFGFKLGPKSHNQFEFYPSVANGDSWVIANGPLVTLIDSNPDFDGWGNAATINSDGGITRYTLDEARYNKLTNLYVIPTPNQITDPQKVATVNVTGGVSWSTLPAQVTSVALSAGFNISSLASAFPLGISTKDVTVLSDGVPESNGSLICIKKDDLFATQYHYPLSTTNIYTRKFDSMFPPEGHNDPFSGNNGDSPNTWLWTSQVANTASIFGGKLRLLVQPRPGGADGTGYGYWADITSRYSISGNFDISWSMDRGGVNRKWGLRVLKAQDMVDNITRSNAWTSAVIQQNSGGDLSLGTKHLGGIDNTDVTTSASFLRMKRIGETVQLSYKVLESDPWTTLTKSCDSDDVWIQFFLVNDAAGYTKDFDNFTVVSSFNDPPGAPLSWSSWTKNTTASDISLITSTSISAVPNTRTINTYPLTGNINLTSSDIGGLTTLLNSKAPTGDYATNTSLATKLSATGGTLTNYNETVGSRSISGTVSIALSAGNVQDLTLTGITTISLPATASNPAWNLTLRVSCAATGGYALSYAASPTITWVTSDNVAPQLNTATGKVNVLVFESYGSKILGHFGGKEA